MLFQKRRVRRECCGEASGFRASGKIFYGGKFWREVAVDEDEARTGLLREDESVELIGRNARTGIKRGIERQLGDGGGIREAPILVIQRGRADLAEAREASLADGQQPFGLIACGLEATELSEIRFR